MDANGNATLLDYLDLGARTATGLLNKPAAAAPAATASKTNWALIGGIAAAFLGVLLLVMVVGRRGG